MKPIKAKSYKDFQKELDKLQADHYHLQSIFKVAPIGIALVVGEEIRFINNQFCDIMGCKNNNLVGKNFEHVFPDKREYKRFFKKRSEEINKKGICKIETKFKRKDGTIIYIYLSSTLLDPDDQSLGATYTVLDITDLKKTEMRLHTQVEQNEQILKTTLDGYILADTEGKIKDVNQSYCEMIGYSREELLQMNIREVELQLSNKRTEQMVQQGRDRFETKHKRKDGVILYLDVSVVIMNFDQGPFVAWFTRDITEQRKAENELKKSEKKYRSFFEYNDAVILFINPEDHTIYFANKAAVKYYGYSKNELIGMKMSSINTIPVDAIRTKMKEARKKEQNYFVFKHRLASGEIRDVQVYQTKLYLNEQELFSIIVQDITDQKKAKEEIRKKEEQFQTVIEAAGDAIFVADFETSRILLVNKQACKTLGYSQKELLKKTIGDLDPGFGKQNHQKNIWANLTNGEAITIEVLHKHKDGTVSPAEVRIGIIKYNGKKAVLGFARDISERKQMEIELKQHREKLEELVKERTLELEEKNKELEKYNDMFIGREFRIKELKEKLKIFENKHNDKNL